MNHDALFKRLLKRPSLLQDFLNLFLPDVAVFVDFSRLEFVDKERTTLEGKMRTGDLLVKTRIRGRAMGFLIHLEHQAQLEPRLGRRMLEYFVLDWREYSLPVYPIVVMSHAAPGLRDRPPVIMDFPNRRVLEFYFDVVDLRRLDALSYVRKRNAAALALAARMRHDRRRRVELVKEFLVGLVATSAADEEKDAVANFFFAYQRLTREERLQLNAEVDKLDPEFREEVMQRTNPWIEEGMEIGIQKGIEQGIEKGIQQGRRQGEVELVLRLLRRRLGEVGRAQEKSIRNLELSEIERLGESVLEFKSRKDLFDWLKRNA